MSADERRARAEARRRSAMLRRTSLGAEEVDFDPIDGARAIALATVLSRESWAATGVPVPDYDRANTPIRFVRGRLT